MPLTQWGVIFLCSAKIKIRLPSRPVRVLCSEAAHQFQRDFIFIFCSPLNSSCYTDVVEIHTQLIPLYKLQALSLVFSHCPGARPVMDLCSRLSTHCHFHHCWACFVQPFYCPYLHSTVNVHDVVKEVGKRHISTPRRLHFNYRDNNLLCAP